MSHLISQEWQEIRLRNFVDMIFDARALNVILFEFKGATKKLTIFIFGVKLLMAYLGQ
jgi:hypothetical protein